MEYLPRPKDAVLPPVEIEVHDVERFWFEASWSDYEAGTHWTSFPKRYGYLHEKCWGGTGPWAERVYTQEFLIWLAEIRKRTK